MYYRWKVTGSLIINNERVPFETTTPPCQNAYQAELYVLGRFSTKENSLAILSSEISAILE